MLVCVGGDDPEKADALPRDLVEAARARGVRFLGHRDDVAELLGAFDVFVLASHREGFPRAAMEAAAMGLPVVATDIRGCREIVVPGVNGALVPVRDPVALTDALAGFADPDRRARAGAASRARAEEHFDERAVVERVLAAYRAVARRKGLSRVGVPRAPIGCRGDANTGVQPPATACSSTASQPAATGAMSKWARQWTLAAAPMAARVPSSASSAATARLTAGSVVGRDHGARSPRRRPPRGWPRSACSPPASPQSPASMSTAGMASPPRLGSTSRSAAW